MSLSMVLTTDIKELQDRLSRIEHDLPNVIEGVTEKHLLIIEERAKGLAPVDTGYLRDNIRSLGAKMAGDIISGELVSGADYSSYLEFGTVTIPEKRFLRDALEAEVNSLTQDLESAIEALLARR